jgi:hypothetical protein
MINSSFFACNKMLKLTFIRLYKAISDKFVKKAEKIAYYIHFPETKTKIIVHQQVFPKMQSGAIHPHRIGKDHQ